jgi:formylglycine-generating enzyme required for sulfatase activity
MTNDLAAQLAFLRQQRAAAPDAVTRAMFDSLIALLEAQQAASRDTATGDNIAVGDMNQAIGVAIGAGARATVYIDGRQGKTNDELLAAYYRRLAQRCRSVPLQGVYEQRSTADSLSIDLDQVYTQLATTTRVEREHLDRAALERFDAAAFLAAHTGPDRLPVERRTAFRVAGGARAKRGAEEREPLGVDTLTNLEGMDADDLAQYAHEADRITFLGPELVSEAIAAAPRLVLLGEPGSGKSTALRYLAYVLAGAGLDPQIDLAACLPGWTLGRRLPVFAPLLPLAKRFADDPTRQGEADDLWNYLVEHLQSKDANPGLAAAVHEEIAAGRAILLLDGLDEVAGAESRRKVVRAVQSFAARYPTCRMVVACRVRAYEGERNAPWRLPGWPSATLADWTISQMRFFVQAWYHTLAGLRGRPEVWRDERIAGLTRAIAAREDLQRFGRQPLMLTVMALVHLNDGRLPEERASLYGRCIDILLGQWEIAGKDASAYGAVMDYIGLPDADVQSLRPLLGKAAYEAHRAAAPGAVGRLSRAVLRTMVDDDLKRRGHPNPSDGADRLLDYADLRAGLIQASDAGDEYSFPHQTFQEYLAGIELLGGVNPLERVLAQRNDDRWRRPILLGVEHLALSSLDLPYRLLSRLVEEPGRTAPQCAFDLLLAQEIANDLGWAWLEQRDPLFSGLKRRLAAALAATLGEPSAPARDLVQAGDALAELGDPRPGVCTLPPAMLDLPGGSFVIGITPEEIQRLPKDEQRYFARSQNEQSVTIAAFTLARYPVTNAQYQLFIDAGGYDPAAPWWDAPARAWLSRDDVATEGLERWQRRDHKDRPEWWEKERFGIARPNYPVVGVSWYEASAFCRWLTQHLNDGCAYRLPSEAEWEYAARGTARRIYPWGDAEPDAERANFKRIYDGASAVGCFPRGATPEGVFDLAGNVWEWTCSEYRPYPYDPDDGRETGDEPAEKRFTTRGGSWLNRPFSLRAANRYLNTPDTYNDLLSFRLARRPPV